LKEPYRSDYPFTQAHLIRQRHLVKLGQEIDAKDIPGAVVECGVLDGGTAALMALATSKSGRPVHLFDSWEGLPKITIEDGDAEKWSGDVVGSPKRVVSIFDKLGIDRSRVTFHVGWFDKTFAKAKIEEIALLHIDGDFYSSVKLSIDTWAPLMARGGYIQIDDYDSFIGCRKAIDEFLDKRPD
jgi:O-methyltransferase